MDFYESFVKDTNCMTPTNDPLSAPHSSSFLDLDGDCMPDLFLTKYNEKNQHNYYELYI